MFVQTYIQENYINILNKHEYAENIYLVNVIYQPLHIKEKVMKGISDHVMFSCLS